MGPLRAGLPLGAALARRQSPPPGRKRGPATGRARTAAAGRPGARASGRGPLPAAAGHQYRLDEESRQDEQADGQQHGLQPLRHACGSRCCLVTGRGWCRGPAGGDGGGAGGARRWARPGAGVPGRRVREGEHGPGVDRRSDRGRWPAGWPRTGPASRRARRARPRCRTGCHRPQPCSGRAPPAGQRQHGAGVDDSGSGPMARRLAAYRAGQPPRTAKRAAMPDKVSPGWTTYLVAGVARRHGRRGDGQCAGEDVFGILLAVRMVAWAGWTDPFMPAVTRVIDRMVQASTTHADLVHVRMVLSLSFRGDQRRTLLVRTPNG